MAQKSVICGVLFTWWLVMIFEEWKEREQWSDHCNPTDFAKAAWEAAWHEGLAEGYREGIKDSKFCLWCLEELEQEQE